MGEHFLRQQHGVCWYWFIIVSERIRKKYPGRFGPGPRQTVRHYWRVCVNRCCLCREVEGEEVEELLEESEQLLRKLEEEFDEKTRLAISFKLVYSECRSQIATLWPVSKVPVTTTIKKTHHHKKKAPGCPNQAENCRNEFHK
jgi:hypothetical protein